MIRSCIDLSAIFVGRGRVIFVRRGPDKIVGRGLLLHPGRVDGINAPLQHLLGALIPNHVNPQIAPLHQRGQQAGHAPVRQPKQLREVAVLGVAVPALIQQGRHLAIE